MIEISPVHAAAVLALLIAYKLLMWLACRAIDSLNVITKHDRRARTRHVYQERCSTAPEPRCFEYVVIVGVILLLDVIAVLSGMWLGQELVEYLTCAFWAARP